MKTNILSYLCFLVLCGLVVLDMWFCSSVVLQMLCIVLALLVVVLVTYIAYKLHKGTYMSNELQTAYKGLISDNIALTNELTTIKQKAKQTAVGGVELQNLITFNRRLTAQIANLQVRITQQAEQINELKIKLKSAQSTPIVAMATSEQLPKSKLNKSKSA